MTTTAYTPAKNLTNNAPPKKHNPNKLKRIQNKGSRFITIEKNKSIPFSLRLIFTPHDFHNISKPTGKMKIFLNIEHLKNFNFPSTFIEFATTEPETDIEPWWLLIYQEGKINYWHNTLKNLYPNRTLVPFAKFNANDDIACFDGDDLSGNPKVLIIHAYASEGWELHGEHPDFSAWLKTAIETHTEWNEED